MSPVRVKGRSLRRSRTPRTCRSKTWSCTSSVGNARRWRPRRGAVHTPRGRRSCRGTATARSTVANRPSQIDHGPGGGPCPGASLPFNPSLRGGRSEQTGGCVQPVDDDDLPRRRKPEHAARAAAHAAGPVGNPDRGEAVLRSAGQRRDVRRGKPDRRNDGVGRGGLGSGVGQGWPRVSDRKVRRRAVRAVDRQPREGRPVRPRARHLEPEPAAGV